MITVLLYLVKANIALLLFYGVYRVGLYKLTFYRLNRVYLLFSILFSLTFPLFHLQIPLKADFALVGDMSAYAMPVSAPADSGGFPFLAIVISLLAAGGFYFAARMVLRLASLWQVHRHSIPSRWNHFKYRFLVQPIQPFSFWKNIYVHTESQTERELYDIFTHEKVHTDELHTLDVLLAELACILCWFNPATWLLKRAVRDNLEFITDKKVIESGVDKKSYQYSLLQVSNLLLKQNTGNGFNFSDLKRRISMMNSQNSSPMHLGKYFFIFPLCVLLLITFGFMRTASTDEPDTVSQISDTAVVVRGYAIAHTEIENTSSTNQSQNTPHARRLRPRAPVPSTKLIKMPAAAINGQYLDIDAAEQSVRQLTERVSTPKKTVTLRGRAASGGTAYLVVDGVQSNDLDIPTSEIESIQVYKGEKAIEKYGQGAQHGVVEITTKGYLRLGHPFAK